MQRPGHKLNTREANPNSYITFIRSLPNKPNPEEAEHILKAVAAQVQRIMRDRFMLIGTLEEAAYNGVFAGRNWNHGQTVELVLRRPNGHFYPLKYILSVMAHEMAHITHMNHGPDFQKLNKAIKQDIAEWQAKGHYGDGFWSNGKRLYDGALLGGEGVIPSELPQYVCGVTKSDARKARPRRGRGPASSRAPSLVKGEASLRSGRQTAYRRKAGARNNVDMGESNGRLDGRKEITKEDHEERKKWIDVRVRMLVGEGLEEKKAKRRAAEQFKKAHPSYREGSTRGKQAKSKTAAELRAAAAERRLLGSAPKVEEEEEGHEEEDELIRDGYESEEGQMPSFGGSDEEGGEVEIVDDPHLSIEERRRELLAERSDDEEPSEADGLRPEWREFLSQAVACAERHDQSRSRRSGLASGSKPSTSSYTPIASPSAPSSPIYIGDSSDDDHAPPRKRRATVKTESPNSEAPTIWPSTSTSRQSGSSSFGVHALVREQRLRALGLTPTTLSPTSRSLEGSHMSLNRVKMEDGADGWACQVCSLNNPASRTRCGVCEARPDGTGTIAQ